MAQRHVRQRRLGERSSEAPGENMGEGRGCGRVRTERHKSLIISDILSGAEPIEIAYKRGNAVPPVPVGAE
jgi:hypothetical protein